MSPLSMAKGLHRYELAEDLVKDENIVLGHPSGLRVITRPLYKGGGRVEAEGGAVRGRSRWPRDAGHPGRLGEARLRSQASGSGRTTALLGSRFQTWVLQSWGVCVV